MCHNQTTINSSPPSAAYMCRWIGTALVQMAARLFGPKPLSKPMLGYCQLDQIQNFSTFHSRKCIWRGGEGLRKHRSGSTVVPDSTKPLHEPMVNFHPWVSVPDSKVHGTNMGPIRGRQNPCWPHVGPMIFAIWGGIHLRAILQRVPRLLFCTIRLKNHTFKITATSLRHQWVKLKHLSIGMVKQHSWIQLYFHDLQPLA